MRKQFCISHESIENKTGASKRNLGSYTKKKRLVQFEENWWETSECRTLAQGEGASARGAAARRFYAAVWSHLACWRGARAPPRGSCRWPWCRGGAGVGVRRSCRPVGTVLRFNRAGRRGAPWRPTGPRLLDWQRHLRLRSARRRRCQP